MRAAIPLLMSSLLLTGCITAAKQQEVYSAIRDVGFLEADARCISSRAGRQLSIRELRSLQRAANAVERPVRDATVGQVIDAISQNVEPETLGTLVRLASECLQARTQAIGG
ncbi:MAG: hypothetical protein J7493_06660 [Porphyrobacter sp.]|nr:hypothetical protein [Porphyrobacter sp.]